MRADAVASYIFVALASIFVLVNFSGCTAIGAAAGSAFGSSESEPVAPEDLTESWIGRDVAVNDHRGESTEGRVVDVSDERIVIARPPTQWNTSRAETLSVHNIESIQFDEGNSAVTTGAMIGLALDVLALSFANHIRNTFN